MTQLKGCTDLNKEFSMEESQMTEKHFLAMGEMKIKTTLRFCLIPIRMAKVNNPSESSHWC